MIETGVLKFEYSHGRADTDDLLNINNKFITCSPKCPRMLSSDKLLFLVIIDEYNKKSSPKIIGRANTYGFVNTNIATQNMINKYSGLSHYKYYVELYNVEVIDKVIKDCIPLYDIIAQFQHSMFPHTIAKNPYRAYAQQSYRLISNSARDYINQLLNAEKLIKL